MNKGKKQSPFIGRRVPFVDNGVPILYPRYTDVSEIVVDGPGKRDRKRQAPEQDQPATAAAAANGPAANGSATTAGIASGIAPSPSPAAADAVDQQPSKKSKKQLKKQKKLEATAAQQQQQEGTAAAAADEAVAWEPEEDEEDKALRLRREEKARKKREKQAKRQAELAAEAAAGAGAQPPQQQQTADTALPQPTANDQTQQQQQHDKGNAEEAAKIRSVLGFSTDQQQQQPAAAAAACKAPPPSSFAFNFGNLGSGSSNGTPSTAATAADRIAAETEAKLAAIQAVDATIAAADKDGCVPRRVFVGGMPYTYTREQIAEYWCWCGEIESLDMLTFPDTGRFRGIVFITFKSQEGVDAALQYDGEQCEGQTLKVERCKAATMTKHIKAAAAVAGKTPNRQQQQPDGQQQNSQTPQQQQQQQPAAAPSGDPRKNPGYNVAYVGNIAFEAGPDDIRTLFADCGVTKVRLHTDRDTGKSRGYAHVHFADEAGLDNALQLSGSELHGRAIKVSPGQPRKN